MNVSCPECRTTYRIDPARVPPRGVRARCIRCPGVFPVEPRMDEPVAQAAAEARSAPAADRPGVPADAGASQQAPSQADARVVGSDRNAPATTVGDPAEGAADAAGVEPPHVGDESAEPRIARGAQGLGPAPFGSRDPDARARRLARALISDIVVYHPDRRDRSLRDGTLRQEFHEEIRKSWDEYAAQVGARMARETRYFQDALNEILAGGNRLF